ncbi:MAG: hypothetical protein R8L07_12070 [Alphaproteobacteria bacterium]|nr:hypothetical protein [Alphaproteobacteria bacterium]
MALLLASVPVAGSEADDCNGAVPDVERAMQDGLSDLSDARGLTHEAQSHLSKAPGPESTACRFLTNGRDAYQRAAAHFRKCETLLDAILAECPDPDWSALSASPQSCPVTRMEIESSLAVLAGDHSAACGD